MKITKIATLILFSVLSFVSFAEMATEMFIGSDIDGNGCIDKKEAQAVQHLSNDEIFDRFDEDGNGCINSAEFREFVQQNL